LLGVLTMGKGQLLEPRFNLGREMYFHTLQDTRIPEMRQYGKLNPRISRNCFVQNLPFLLFCRNNKLRLLTEHAGGADIGADVCDPIVWLHPAQLRLRTFQFNWLS
jgi:hypothetical protein